MAEGQTWGVDNWVEGVSEPRTKPASAAAVGKSKATVAGSATPNLAARAFRSSTAPKESRPACHLGMMSLWGSLSVLIPSERTCSCQDQLPEQR